MAIDVVITKHWVRTFGDTVNPGTRLTLPEALAEALVRRGMAKHARARTKAAPPAPDTPNKGDNSDAGADPKKKTKAAKEGK